MRGDSDRIGKGLVMGSSGELELRFGLERLAGLSGATVEIEGRSRATSAHVDFEITNPGLECGAEARMSQDWSPDVVRIAFDDCIEPGNDFQAIRVTPTGGSMAIALLRLRLTLYGATW